MIDYIGPIIFQLLLKDSQDKDFACEVVDKALIMTTTTISPNLLLQKLELYVNRETTYSS